MYCLENNLLKAEVNSLGAELRSLFDKRANREYIWQRDAKYWAKSSPVLFPFVGELTNGRYSYQGEIFQMSKHGFARDRDFQLIEQSDDRLIFRLRSAESDQKIYPFSFDLLLCYELKDTKVSCSYEVRNRSDEPMFFSLGAHPALQLDFSNGQQLSDYHLLFPKDKSLNRFFLQNGLLQAEASSIKLDEGCLSLNADMFNQDAWVLKGLLSSDIILKNKKEDYHLNFSFVGFPYFGIWSVPGSSFICLEPWCGLNDSEIHSGELLQKEGIMSLESHGHWSRTWSIEMK